MALKAGAALADSRQRFEKEGSVVGPGGGNTTPWERAGMARRGTGEVDFTELDSLHESLSEIVTGGGGGGSWVGASELETATTSVREPETRLVDGVA